MLAWLLDPTKEHGFGDALLRALLIHLTSDRRLPTLHVDKTEAEFIIDNGRLDVLVRGRYNDDNADQSGWLLLIEAKVDANEAEDQLWKYERWANKHANRRQVYRIFLTPEGRPPTTAREPWIPISFSQLACIFRAVCPELRDRPGFHFLKHYLSGVLKDICRWQLPIVDPRSCGDIYSFAEYIKIVTALSGERL
jgi:hypothetical protein